MFPICDNFQDNCIRCQGAIFEPERFKTKSHSYHRNCFTCNSCAKSLVSSLADIVIGGDNDIYCNKCHKEKFDQDSSVAYSDPKAVKAEDGKGCWRCHGKVFTAEQIVEKGKVFHSDCFTCKKCKKALKDRVKF